MGDMKSEADDFKEKEKKAQALANEILGVRPLSHFLGECRSMRSNDDALSLSLAFFFSGRD